MFALMVTRSLVASPRVTLPLKLKLPDAVPDARVESPATLRALVVEKFVAVPVVRMVLPATLSVVPTDNACENEPDPTISRATVGAVVPTPSRPENDAVPAVKI